MLGWRVDIFAISKNRGNYMQEIVLKDMHLFWLSSRDTLLEFLSVPSLTRQSQYQVNVDTCRSCMNLHLPVETKI